MHSRWLQCCFGLTSCFHDALARFRVNLLPAPFPIGLNLSGSAISFEDPGYGHGLLS